MNREKKKKNKQEETKKTKRNGCNVVSLFGRTFEHFSAGVQEQSAAVLAARGNCGHLHLF